MLAKIAKIGKKHRLCLKYLRDDCLPGWTRLPGESHRLM